VFLLVNLKRSSFSTSIGWSKVAIKVRTVSCTSQALVSNSFSERHVTLIGLTMNIICTRCPGYEPIATTESSMLLRQKVFNHRSLYVVLTRLRDLDPTPVIQRSCAETSPPSLRHHTRRFSCKTLGLARALRSRKTMRHTCNSA